MSNPQVPVDRDLADCASRGDISHSDAAIYTTARRMEELSDQLVSLKKTVDDLTAPKDVPRPPIDFVDAGG